MSLPPGMRLALHTSPGRRRQESPASTPSLLDVLRERAEARAILVAEGAMDFHDAVDGLQLAAVEYGLVADIGQDEVQRIIAAAFARVWP